ncbi:MAG: T9SS type A sorting domain-containing protein [Bacteroidota bacterium]
MQLSANIQNPTQKLWVYLRTKLLLFAVITQCFCFFNSNAQTPGSNDNTFNPGTGATNFVEATAIQSDGKIIVGGSFMHFNGTPRNSIARINDDGSLDGPFNPVTGIAYVRTISLQTDGKIIIGGRNFSFSNLVTRINTDGTLDGTYTPGSGPDSDVYSSLLQSDGKIIIGGGFTFYNGTARNNIARLNSDGTLDGTFDPGLGANNGNTTSTIWTSALQSDGKIIIGGSFTLYNGVARNYIARLSVDGTLDTTFDPGTGANSFVYTSSIQSDGKIIIGGVFTTYNGIARNGIARLNTNGTLDLTFDPGTGANNSVEAIQIQGDGKIIIGGGFTSYNGVPRKNIARLNSDGTLDTNFDTSVGANDVVYSAEIQSDGKIIIGGFFTSYDNVTRNCIARILVQNTVGVAEQEQSKNVIYNNSTNTLIVSECGNLVIYNMQGAKVKELKVNSQQVLSVSAEDLGGAGVYIWQLQTEKEVQRGKIIIQE